jgi:hypothetical protein
MRQKLAPGAADVIGPFYAKIYKTSSKNEFHSPPFHWLAVKAIGPLKISIEALPIRLQSPIFCLV